SNSKAALSGTMTAMGGRTRPNRVEVLFVRFGSDTLDDTVATLVIDPAEFGRATMAMLTLSALAKLPSEQVTIPAAWLQLPRLGVAETKLAPAGRTSVSTTFRAALGPLLVTVTE